MPFSSLFLRSRPMAAAVLSLLVIPSLVAGQASPKPNVGPYTYAGCYNELYGVRLLPDNHTVSDQMTVEQCVSDCQGSAYIGMEYAGECWCAEALYETPVLSEGGESDCSLLCHGDDTEICGGALKISLYELSNGPFVLLPPQPTVVDSSPASSTTVDDSAQTSAAATTAAASSTIDLEAAASSSAAATSAAATNAAATSIEAAASSTTIDPPTSVPTSPAGNPLTIAGWDSIGCFSSTDTFSTFKFVGTSNSMDIDTCIASCSASAYAFAGVHADSCYCASTLGRDDNYIEFPADDCDIPCSGNPDEFCGGDIPVMIERERRQSGVPVNVILTIFGAPADSSPSSSSSTSTCIPSGTGSIPTASGTGVFTNSSTSTTYTPSGTGSLPAPTGGVYTNTSTYGASSSTSIPYPTVTPIYSNSTISHYPSSTTSAILSTTVYTVSGHVTTEVITSFTTFCPGNAAPTPAPTTKYPEITYTTVVVTTYVDICPTGPVTETVTSTLVLTGTAYPTYEASIPYETLTKSYVSGGVTYSQTVTVPLTHPTTAGPVVSFITATVIPTQVGGGSKSVASSAAGAVVTPAATTAPAVPTYLSGGEKVGAGIGSLLLGLVAAVAML